MEGFLNKDMEDSLSNRRGDKVNAPKYLWVGMHGAKFFPVKENKSSVVESKNKKIQVVRGCRKIFPAITHSALSPYYLPPLFCPPTDSEVGHVISFS
jgi:hypothetical protein